MMASWTVAGWAAWKMFTQPATSVIFQSEDEERALHDVEYVKVLWENTLPELQARWKPYKDRHPRDQPKESFTMENASWCKGIVGNPNKIRSEHPTIVILDEAAHIIRGEESFNIATATRCRYIVCLSSANPGWFADIVERADQIHWPDFKQKAA